MVILRRATRLLAGIVMVLILLVVALGLAGVSALLLSTLHWLAWTAWPWGAVLIFCVLSLLWMRRE